MVSITDGKANLMFWKIKIEVELMLAIQNKLQKECNLTSVIFITL